MDEMESGDVDLDCCRASSPLDTVANEDRLSQSESLFSDTDDDDEPSPGAMLPSSPTATAAFLEASTIEQLSNSHPRSAALSANDGDDVMNFNLDFESCLTYQQQPERAAEASVNVAFHDEMEPQRFLPQSPSADSSHLVSDESSVFAMPSGIKVLRARKKLPRVGGRFLDLEARVGGRATSDDEDEGGLSQFEYDPSFIDLNSQPQCFTQNPISATQTHAFYIQSVRDAQFGRPNKFVIGSAAAEVPAEECEEDDDSEMFPDQHVLAVGSGENSYLFDSFIVPNDFVEYANDESDEWQEERPLPPKRRLRRLRDPDLSSSSDDGEEDASEGSSR